jgi:HTH-type transcriptional regulator/antitoxin HipB
MNLSQKLKEARLRVGLSQEEVARRVGCSVRTYARWERGETMPQTRYLQALARVLGVTVDDLVKEDT